jgi:hypothetical protein
MAVLVIPNLNISINEPDDINSTHCPNTSIGKLRASKAKPANPKKAMVRLPASDRKLSSLIIFMKVDFNLLYVKDGSANGIET